MATDLKKLKGQVDKLKTEDLIELGAHIECLLQKRYQEGEDEV